MRIYEMTATFGKLEGETLTLKPGLNIIEAPNEWGKSTWCAFLLAMLYGVDTRSKTTKTALADKEHYLPWSGKPMSGRMRIRWQGRDITVERSTKGRVPMGEFSAYETESGLQVPQLTAENCGEMLLGTEQSVFRRAGFVRLADLPVTRDDALYRRLNALVTTGDESDDGQQLARALKDLKNQCRYNKSGMLPKAEGELRQTEDALRELRDLRDQSELLWKQEEALMRQEEALQNHVVCLKNQRAGEDSVRVQEAKKDLDASEENLQRLQAICNELPSPEEAQEKQKQILELSGKWDQLLRDQQEVPQLAPPPETPKVFAGLSPRQARDMVQTDRAAEEKLRLPLSAAWIAGAAAFISAALLLFVKDLAIPGILSLGAVGGLLAWGLIQKAGRKARLKELADKYGDPNPDVWQDTADRYFLNAQNYGREVTKIKKAREAFNVRVEQLREEKKTLCGEKTLKEVTEVWQEVSRYWQSYWQAQKEHRQQKDHLEALQSMANQEQAPAQQDELTGSEEETLEKLQETRSRRQELLGKIGQYQGRMEALGTEDALIKKQIGLRERIRKLEEFQEAVVIAQTNLEAAALELQRRFAPKITSRARELMGRMTGGRYEKLTMDENFSLNTGAEQENTLHSALWRSEGTMDQMYLSLRLAVSEALTPEAPLVLDDALVRFDSQRLQRTLEILKEEGEEKQVILFTCQDREGKLLPEAVIRK